MHFEIGYFEFSMNKLWISNLQIKIFYKIFVYTI